LGKKVTVMMTLELVLESSYFPNGKAGETSLCADVPEKGAVVLGSGAGKVQMPAKQVSS
jgi:hypothetical protein